MNRLQLIPGFFVTVFFLTTGISWYFICFLILQFYTSFHHTWEHSQSWLPSWERSQVITPFFKGTFESMILRTSRFGWGYVFGLPWRVISLGVVFARRPSHGRKRRRTTSSESRHVGAIRATTQGRGGGDAGETGSCFQNEALYSGWLWWKICLSKKLWI